MTDETFDAVSESLAQYFGSNDTGFLLIAVSPHGETTRKHVAANLPREYAIRLVEETLENMKEQEDDAPHPAA